tara:strand:+ start:2713 stop:3783 length:1071 start_codon:yes stop_codon:yes gene_type:complete
MLNIIIPIYGITKQDRDLNSFNRVDIFDHIQDRSILSWSLTHIEQYNKPKRYFIISTDKYIQENYIDKVISLHTNSEINIINLNGNTMGMPCAVLMGMDKYNLDEPFLVTSADQYIDTNLKYHIDYFKSMNAAGGTIGFKSVHPKWSYAEVNEDNYITRVIEKVPISQNALTSTYFFSTGHLMTESIKNNIIRRDLVNNRYYLAPCMNELIINNYKVAFSSIPTKNYFNFYANSVKDEFKQYLDNKKNINYDIVKDYYHHLNLRDSGKLSKLLDDDISLILVNNEKINGHANAMLYYERIIDSNSKDKVEIISSSLIDNKTIICHIKTKLDNTFIESINIIELINMKIVSIKEFIN